MREGEGRRREGRAMGKKREEREGEGEMKEEKGRKGNDKIGPNSGFSVILRPPVPGAC